MKKKTEVELLEDELKKGNTKAYYNLGYIYLLGQGIEENATKAVEYFRKGTTHQNTKCMQGLAMCYKHGDGVNKDLTKMIYWLHQGIKLNDFDCQYQLALCYYEGIGVNKDYDKAIELMKEIETKNKDAKHWLKERGLNSKNFFERLFGE